MIYENQYVKQTEQLIDFYKDKQSRIKEYIVTCHNYISELQNIDAIKLFTELEYERAFVQLLDLVQETYRPNQFVSCCSDSLIRIFDDQFIVYMLSVKNQLKRPITWKQLVQLSINFITMELEFNLATNFKEDFTHFAVNKITLSELWDLKT